MHAHNLNTFRNHPKYHILLQRGYTDRQIQTLLQQRQKMYHCPQQVNSSTDHTSIEDWKSQSTFPQHAFHKNIDTYKNACGPPRPQHQPIEDSVMFSYENQSNVRRMHNVVRAFPENVPPRADIQMQFKPDKSSVESMFQNTYEQRENDMYVPKMSGFSKPTQATQRAQLHTLSSPNKNTSHSTPSIKHHNSRKQIGRKNVQDKRTTRRQRFEQEIQTFQNTKVDPYRMLDVSQDYTLRELAKKYRKAALKYHPDKLVQHKEYMTHDQKQHYENMFGQLTKAYLFLIEEFHKRESDKSFHELREQSLEECAKQDESTNQKPIHLGEGDNFNVELFNKLYNENRLYDVNDEGYDDWMKSDNIHDTSKLFSNKFNANIFNTTFEQLKKDDPYSNQQLVKHQEMGVVVHSNSTPYTTLGEDNIKDFSGTTSSLQYSDLKSAHTTHATLIDASRVQQQPTFKSIKEMEAYRSQIKHTLSPEEAELQEYLKQKHSHEEQERLERLQARDLLVSQQHEKIQQRLLQ